MRRRFFACPNSARARVGNELGERYDKRFPAFLADEPRDRFQGSPRCSRVGADRGCFRKRIFFHRPSFSYADVDLAVSAVSPSPALWSVPSPLLRTARTTVFSWNADHGAHYDHTRLGSGIPAGSYVRILLGTNAPGGTYQITNPGVTASYRILLNTYDTGGGALDYGAAMVAILPAIGVSANLRIL